MSDDYGIDVCGFGHRTRKPSPTPTIVLGESSETLNYGGEQYIRFRFSGQPKRREYFTIKSRFDSFDERWPKKAPVTPEKLAEAGFFFDGMCPHHIIGSTVFE